ncbi:MAG: hypothetical protein E7L15_17410 [Citrobacter portucalensis]|nr:hypothetical protein [Citrobacter portucalensis]
MNILERVYDYLNDAGLLTGWTAQLQFWNDSENGDEQFIVIQSNGGTQVRQDLGNDFYFSVYVVGKHGQYNVSDVDAKANEIIEYIKQNPLDGCLGYIQLQAPLGRPMLTDEKRPVHELLLRVVRG